MTALEKGDFQRLLFRTAFCLMACDGHIDEREVKEIKAMNKSASYFQGIDLTDELETLIANLKEKGKQFVDELCVNLDKLNISYIQELLILEVALRIIYADTRVDENEIKFLRFIRSKLNVHDEIIRDRFGVVEYLFDKDYSQDIIQKETFSDLLSTINMPELTQLSEIDFSDIESKEKSS